MTNLTSNDERLYVGNVRVRAENDYRYIATATNTTVKSGEGVLRSLAVNKAVASGEITIYDSVIATGSNIIGKITFPGTLLQNQVFLPYDVNFSTGLSIKTSQATDITVSYA